jgi:hypothetical protein
MVLLYAVTDADAPAAEGAGLGDKPLRAVTHEDLRAVISDTEHTPPTDEAQLWAYEQVVERLMADTAILPARFGTTAEGDEEITAMLAERQSELTGALARVREAVEYAVRPPVPVPVPVPVPAEHSVDPVRPGTAYMERLLTQSRHIRELDEAADPLFRAKQRTAYGTAYLVDRTQADEFVRAAWERGLTITGPWPPYSFTTVS